MLSPGPPSRSPRPLPASHTKPQSEPGLPPPENKRFYPALDGVRAFAVLLVFWQHYYAAQYPALNWGWVGVDIFFVLSGFLITGILYDTRNTPRRVRNFYMRRTLRIFPLYYGILFLALCTTPIFHWFWNRAWLLWFLYLGNYARFLLWNSPLVHVRAPLGVIEHLQAQPITPNAVTVLLGHFWSLCVEEQFYLFWPLIVFTVRRRETLRTICLCSLPAVLLARILCTIWVPRAYLEQELLYRLTPLRLDALLLGGLAALMLRGPEGRHLLRFARPALTASTVAFALWELFYRLHAGFFYHPVAGAPILTTAGYTLIDLAALALVLSVLTVDNLFSSLFNIQPLRQLGKISYGFYVFHDMFHFLILNSLRRLAGRPDFPHSRLITAIVGFGVTLILATLSFRFYETPFLRLKSRFTPESAV